MGHGDELQVQLLMTGSGKVAWRASVRAHARRVDLVRHSTSWLGWLSSTYFGSSPSSGPGSLCSSLGCVLSYRKIES